MSGFKFVLESFAIEIHIIYMVEKWCDHSSWVGVRKEYLACCS